MFPCKMFNVYFQWIFVSNFTVSGKQLTAYFSQRSPPFKTYLNFNLTSLSCLYFIKKYDFPNITTYIPKFQYGRINSVSINKICLFLFTLLNIEVLHYCHEIVYKFIYFTTRTLLLSHLCYIILRFCVNENFYRLSLKDCLKWNSIISIVK